MADDHVLWQQWNGEAINVTSRTTIYAVNKTKLCDRAVEFCLFVNYVDALLNPHCTRLVTVSIHVPGFPNRVMGFMFTRFIHSSHDTYNARQPLINVCIECLKFDVLESPTTGVLNVVSHIVRWLRYSVMYSDVSVPMSGRLPIDIITTQTCNKLIYLIVCHSPKQSCISMWSIAFEIIQTSDRPISYLIQAHWLWLILISERFW